MDKAAKFFCLLGLEPGPSLNYIHTSFLLLFRPRKSLRHCPLSGLSINWIGSGPEVTTPFIPSSIRFFLSTRLHFLVLFLLNPTFHSSLCLTCSVLLSISTRVITNYHITPSIPGCLETSAETLQFNLRRIFRTRAKAIISFSKISQEWSLDQLLIFSPSKPSRVEPPQSTSALTPLVSMPLVWWPNKPT